MTKKILLGPRAGKNSSLGGVVVLFELLIEEYKRNKYSIKIIDTNMANYNNMMTGLIVIYGSILVSAFKKSNHISLHGTASDFIFIAPFIALLSRVVGFKYTLRKFAGSFLDVYKRAGWLKKALIRYGLKNAQYCFFETKYLVDYFRRYNESTFWFPNVRSKPRTPPIEHCFNKNFVFIGQVKKEKGILEILEVFDALDDSYSIDIYGPIVDSGLEREIEKSTAKYRGVIDPEEVQEILKDYDVLVLPTYWSGEGYPGVILEAYSVGLPVVVSNLEGIREIVDSKSGVLVNPQNPKELLAAVQKFNDISYPVYSLNAKKSFEMFDSSLVTRDYLSKIYD